ncbi:MAG: hypothetical protein DMF97_12335 [Acidobacteria bacterium]|nr:MAG: hypothetical protein DMF97_12335 [Acidobacteriota bacterium]
MGRTTLSVTVEGCRPKSALKRANESLKKLKYLKNARAPRLVTSDRRSHALLLFENETHAEIDPGRAQKKHRESPVPRAVKHQAREHDQPVLADLAEGPIQGEHDDVEDNERERREDHARRPNDSRFFYWP